MSKFVGSIQYSELEGGLWELACDDGRRLTLANPDAKIKRQGLRVEIEGTLDEEAMGIAMTGPPLVVRSYRVRH